MMNRIPTIALLVFAVLLLESVRQIVIKREREAYNCGMLHGAEAAAEASGIEKFKEGVKEMYHDMPVCVTIRKRVERK